MNVHRSDYFKHWKYTGIAGGIIAAGLAPLFLVPFVNHQLTMVLTYATIGYGLSLLVGHTGQISLGHTFFVAIGAYGSIELQRTLGLSLPLAICIVAFVCLVIGYLLARPILRLSGFQLALATLALGVLTPVLIRKFSRFTGGDVGRSAPKFSIPGLSDDRAVYYLALVVAVAALILYLWMTRGNLRLALWAVRDRELVARTLGINAARTKSQVFATSAVLAGIGGVVYAKVVGYVGPEGFGFTVAISYVIMIVVGGMLSAWGPLIGGAFLVVVPTWAGDISNAAPSVVYGAIVILLLLFLPGGIAGLIGKLISRVPVRRRVEEPPTVAITAESS